MASTDMNSVRLARGCWTPADAGLADRCAAVLRGCPAESVIVGVTAARLHQLWLPDLPETIEVATITAARRPHEMTRTTRSPIRGRRRIVAPDEIMLLNGLPITTIARTWRDLAAELRQADLVAAGDSALRLGTTVEEIIVLVARGRRVPGIVRARDTVGLLDGRSRSRPESHLRVAVAHLKLPFLVNEPVYRDAGGWLAEPDLALVEAKLALEYQGIDHADPDRMRRDITRFADLRAEGWLALPYGPAEVFGRPWQIAAEVRAAVRSRAPALLR